MITIREMQIDDLEQVKKSTTELAKAIVNAWLASEFDPAGPSAANVVAVNELDAKYKK